MKIPRVNKKLFITLGVACCMRVCCFAQEAQFDYRLACARANSLYRENKYDQALQGYESVIARGFESGNIYYNIGNCYFKKGALGKAAVSYERAGLLIPRDSDLKSNYAYLKSLLNAGPEVFPGNRVMKLIDRATAGVDIDFLTILFSLAYTALCVFLIVSLFLAPLRRQRIPVAIIAVFLCACCAAALKRKIDYRSTCAMVIAQKSEVKFEPFEGATTYFLVGEASKVEVLETSKNWSKIRRFDAKAGWLHKEALERLKE